MRIAIVGAGALGSAFGAGFARAGHDVAFVEVSAELVRVLERRGLTIVHGGSESTVAVTATTDAASVAPRELVMVFVKSYDTEGAAATLAPLLGPGTVLATLQNGLGNAEILSGRTPGAAIVQGVTYHSATTLEPGRVRHSPGATFVGPYRGGDPAGAQLVAQACADAGWPAQALPDAASAVWRKLLVNTTNAVSALSGVPGAAQVSDDAIRTLLHDVVAESHTVAHALGHTDIDLGACVRAMDDMLARAGDGRASMLQDFDAARRTEVDALNGAVVRAAERVGVDVPLNRALLALVHGWERMHGHR